MPLIDVLHLFRLSLIVTYETMVCAKPLLSATTMTDDKMEFEI